MMADMFADKQFMEHIIRRVCDNPKKYLSDDKEIWFNLTKCMFRNFPAIEVYNLIEQSVYEISDEQWIENKYPRNFFNEDKFKYPKKKRSVIKLNLKKSRIKKLINDNIKITDVANSYGLKVKKGKCLCPFHADSKPSLGFDDERNIFHCFGCNAKGDIIEFVRRLKKNGINLEK